MGARILIRKLPGEEALRLFPSEPSPAAPSSSSSTECAANRAGCHLPLDLSGLRYRPTPPFCAWCGATLTQEVSA